MYVRRYAVSIKTSSLNNQLAKCRFRNSFLQASLIRRVIMTSEGTGIIFVNERSGIKTSAFASI